MRKIQVYNEALASSGISLKLQEKILSKAMALTENVKLTSVPQSTLLSPASASTVAKSQTINSSNFSSKTPTITSFSGSKHLNSPRFEETYARMQVYEAQQQHLLKRSIKKTEEARRKQHTHRPLLNKTSEKLARDQSPLHTRYKEVITHKTQKISDMLHKLKADKEEELRKELTFHPKICESTRNTRTTEEYYHYMRSWKTSIEENQEIKRELKKGSDLQGVTFKPLLNRNSEIMSKNLPCFETRLEHGIELKKQKLSEKRSISPCTFRPHLECSYKKLNLKPVFTRLYTPPIPSHSRA